MTEWYGILHTNFNYCTWIEFDQFRNTIVLYLNLYLI